MLQFMLPSCFNLAGCNPVRNESGLQSRQVRRRKFGIICPYVWNKTEQVQSGIEVSVYDMATFRADKYSVPKSEVIFLLATIGASFAAWVEAVCNGNIASIHSSLVFNLASQFSKGHIAYTLRQLAALHTFDIQVLYADSTVMFYEDGCQLLHEVSTDSGYMPVLTSETAREFAIIARPLYALQTLLFGFRMMAFGELAAQSGYLSLMFTNNSGIMDGNSIRESHGFVKSEVDAYGSVLAFFRSKRMSSMVFFFGNLNLNGNEKLVSVLQNLHTQYLANETQALGHLHVTEVWDVNILMFAVDIVSCIFQMLQPFVGIRELNLLPRADIKGANTISLFVHCRVFGTMGKEIFESTLKVIESMSGGIFCHFVCPWKFSATDSIEFVSQLAPGQASLALLVASLPFRQAPIIGKAATSHGLTEVSPLLVVRHELNAVGDCNHVLFLDVVLYSFLNILQQLLVFVATASIEAGGKYGDDFKDVLGKFLFKSNVLITFVDDYDFYVFSFTNGKDQFGSEPK